MLVIDGSPVLDENGKSISADKSKNKFNEFLVDEKQNLILDKNGSPIYMK